MNAGFQQRLINPSMVRSMNERSVLTTVKRLAPVSGVEISEALQIDPSTVSRILRGLKKMGLIVQQGTGQAGPQGGRKPMLWQLNPKGAGFIGVDLDASHIRCVLMDLSGHVVIKEKLDLPEENDPESVMGVMFAAIDAVLSKSSIDRSRLVGIGVSVPGFVDTHSGTAIYVITLSRWRNVPIAQRIQERFNIPVRVDHDIRAMALGERWFGVAGSYRNFICMGLRTGIGLAIVADGQVYRGGNQFAGDAGHVPIDPAGPRCTCGRRGCLEVMAGERAIMSAVRGLRYDGVQDESLRVSDVVAALQRNDPLVIDIVQRSGDYVGQALANLTSVLDPSAIVVSGELLEDSKVMLKAIQKAFVANQTTYASNIPQIVQTPFGNWCFAVGAGALWYDAFFDVQGFLNGNPDSAGWAGM